MMVLFAISWFLRCEQGAKSLTRLTRQRRIYDFAKQTSRSRRKKSLNEELYCMKAGRSEYQFLLTVNFVETE
jgi:hypothetical protein